MSNKVILIISLKSKETPPVYYGGIERIAAQIHDNYTDIGYQVDVVSKPGSKLHTYSHSQVDEIDYSKYNFILSYFYDENLMRKLDSHNVTNYIMLQNAYSPTYSYLADLKYSKFTVMSKSQQKQYEHYLNMKLPIIPGGIDTGYYKNLGLDRTKDIAFIATYSRNKSPLACLNYARKHDLSIDFYGFDLFKDGEDEYKQKFYDAVREYPKSSLGGQVDNDQKLVIYNKHKYFIFLPGVDDTSWVEPFGLAPLEAMACGCTVITHFGVGGHTSYCNRENSISYKKKPSPLDPTTIVRSISEFDIKNVFTSHYPR